MAAFARDKGFQLIVQEICSSYFNQQGAGKIPTYFYKRSVY